MGKKTQKDSIVEMVLTYLGPDLKPGQPARDLLANEEICVLADEIKKRIISGEIPAGKRIKEGIVGDRNHYGLDNYCKNILYNWLRKDSRLNGGKEGHKWSDLRKSEPSKDILGELDALSRLEESGLLDQKGSALVSERVNELIFQLGSLELKKRKPKLYSAWAFDLKKTRMKKVS